MLAFLLFVILVAAAAYVTVRLVQRHGGAPAPRRREPVRPLGPDDDPEFLRQLEWRRRHPEDPDA